MIAKAYLLTLWQRYSGYSYMKNKSILLYIVILLSFISQFSCGKKSDIDVLNQRLDEFVNVIEKHNKQKIKSFLSSDFSVAKRFNKKQFILFIHYHLKRNKNISISLFNKEINRHNLYVDVTTDALLLGADNWLPKRGQKYYVESRWKIENGKWVMSRLRWEKFKTNE